jgi:hypothetical protein
MTLENKNIALVGAPCAGKSSVLKGLEPWYIQKDVDWSHDSENDKKPYYALQNEVWDDYNPFAHMLLKYFRSLGSIEPTTVEEIKEGMKKEVVWTMPCSIPESDGTVLSVKDITLIDFYYMFGFKFLDTITSSVTSADQLRKVMQIDLLNAQLQREARWSMEADEQNRVTIQEGGPINTVTYFADMPISTYQTTLKSWGENATTVKDLVPRYHHIFLMETLAVLPEEEYVSYFDDGIRLDTPEKARDMNHRLFAEIADIDNVTVLPARMQLEEKIERVRTTAEKIANYDS